MALGTFTAAGSVASNTDTSIAAAPGVGQRIYVKWLTLMVSVAGTTSRLFVSDGAAGSVMARMATTTADAMVNINYTTADRTFPGRALTENTALNLNTTGGAAATVNYEVCYEVKG